MSQNQFKFAELVNDPFADVISAVIGSPDDSNKASSSSDLGKLVKMGTSQNYALCADGDEIEGFVFSIESQTVNQGQAFGSVQRNKRKIVTVATGVSTALKPGVDYVVAGAQEALGTKGEPVVKKGDPATYKWRVIRIVKGTGVAGDQVLIERV